jgi:hypothetical protein
VKDLCTRRRPEVLIDALRSLSAGAEVARRVCAETAGHHTWSRSDNRYRKRCGCCHHTRQHDGDHHLALHRFLLFVDTTLANDRNLSEERSPREAPGDRERCGDAIIPFAMLLLDL